MNTLTDKDNWYKTPITRKTIDECSPEQWNKAAAKAKDRQVGGDHYKGLKIQPIEFIVANDLSYCEANIVKYITRHHQKGGAEDIEKVIHYAQLLLEMEYPQ